VQTSILGITQAAFVMLHMHVSGVVYMKNTIVQYWDDAIKCRNPNAFVIGDRDKQLVRENIVHAILTASNLIRFVILKDFLIASHGTLPSQQEQETNNV
jgi:hypothetical protein